MAKKSSVNKNNHRRKLVAQYAAKRKKLKGIASDLTKPSEERFAARLKLAAVAAQLGPLPHPQPVRADGACARLLPQAEAVPEHAARVGEPGHDPRHDQVELVRRRAYERPAR